MNLKSLTIVFFTNIFLTLAGCELQKQQPISIEHFSLVATQDGQALRLDTQTGEVALVTDKGLTTLPVNGRIRLEVGQLYTMENGELVAYQGNKKFGSADDALLKKYIDEKKAP